ncbi:F/Y-rich N-terminus family protein [Tritrichomonas foetus]|uniref:F/Y-rich N-terminus family protein n=1 Tax=Tritrichomonas foetus TaxID=1144522 RepID=A0A1J4KNR1_9EUKA|nr:F/Y-rich N-terminus family protein [Tritrichomonas foetus]|eukprot:OHT11334.1 F/Y-rich N-terminus family protein [Tritrichomonas foetus]
MRSRRKSQNQSDLSSQDESQPEPKTKIRTRRSKNIDVEKMNNFAKNGKNKSENESKRTSDSTTDNESTDDHHSSAALSDDFVTNWEITSEDEQAEGPDQEGSNDEKIQAILAHKVNSDGSTEYFVKLQGKCYMDCKWVPSRELNNVMIKNYLKKHPNPPTPPFYDPQYDIIDFIVGEKDGKYLVKWKGLDYDNLTFEDEERIDKKLIQQFKKENKIPSLEERFLPPRPKPSDWKPIKTHNPSKKGLQLKSYQFDGLNFLTNAWFNHRNAILADEMGLGKTCQTTVFINYLSTVQKIPGPFLIVVPLSTISHWERELADWAPHLKVLSYYGIKERRKYQRIYEMFYPDTQLPKFNVLVTTYQYVTRDVNLFSTIKWRCVVVDEAHRLKNHKSQLINCIRQFDIDFKLLLTGTPLQNNIEELWTLLNFLDPDAFESMQDFENKFGELKESDQIIQLQSILKPLMIRRRKNDVEQSIIPLEEIIIECPMTQHQKAYYKSIFTRNLEYLSRGAHKDNKTNLLNISMELRKVCNHPYLIRGAEDQILIELRDRLGGFVSNEYAFVNDSLIRSAGKMILLDKLLEKLKKDGHRVLIFSQMTKMLDILQDYLKYKEYKFERLDGQVRGDLRQMAIDNFNDPNSEDFIFLLCTKAGGVGINLTTADTVIIYDSDWNPQNDIQATARCHRIGQTKEVKMYRFITAKSYERKMFETASVKLGLDQALLEQNNKKQHKEDLDKLLKLGAYYAFEDDENEKFNENEDIDTVLLKSTKIKHENIGNSSKFSFTQFELDESDSQVDLSAPDFWQKYLPDVVEDDLSLEGVSMGERRRIMREGADSEAASNAPTSQSNENSDWNKKKLGKVMSNFMKFGWGRWRVIYESSELSCHISDVKEACIVLLGWMIKASSDEHFPVLESIYNGSRSSETKEFEKLFKNYNDTKVSCSSSASKKLSRLDLLYFLNGAVGSCPNPPDDIIVPDIANQKPTEWWTDKDDQLLLHGAWQYGYMNYSDIKFTNTEEQVNMSALTSRLRNLIIGLKNAYMTYKENLNDENIPFNYETLKLTQEAVNKRDHKVILHYINYFGYPDVQQFKKVANLMSKSDKVIEDYLDAIINYCKGKNEFERILVDKIARPDKVLQRLEFFESVRKSTEKTDFRMDDAELIKYVAANGLIGLNSQDFITSRFGSENLESIIFKHLSKVVTGKQILPKSRSTLHNFVIPEYEKNEDGSPILPIKVNNLTIIKDLGKVVYDRKNYHNERYIFPVGYTAERQFTSLEQPNDKAWYLQQILDGGEYPIFRVEMINDKKKRVFEGNAPSKPWTEVVKAIENRKRQLKMGSQRCLTISGPEMFGLYSPLGSHLVQNLENADKCARFLRKKFKNDGDESDDEDGQATSPESKNRSGTDSDNEKKKVKNMDIKSKRNKSRENFESSQQAQSLIRSRPQRNAATRAKEKLELYFDFSEIADQTNDLELYSVMVPENQVVQRDRLDVPVPFSKDPLKAAVKRMAKKVEDDEENDADISSEAQVDSKQ